MVNQNRLRVVNFTGFCTYDASLMEKVKTIEELNPEEKKMVFAFVDAFGNFTHSDPT